MFCNQEKNINCGCKFNIKSFGQCDVTRIKIQGNDRASLNWNEISVPEVMSVPVQKPDIEHLDQVHVDAVINCVKLIETPFSYLSYDRLATPFEIATVTAALDLSVINLAPVIAAINAILAVPGLPAIPAVSAVQAALAAVTAAGTSLTAALAEADLVLAGTCITAAALIAVIQSVQAALNVLNTALQALLVSINALAAATAAIPVVGPLVATAVAAAVTAINTAIASITAALTALLNSITLIGNTSVLVIQANEEGTCLTGRKLVLEGALEQKVVYTALVSSQTVHSVCKSMPFSAYIIPYASFIGLTFTENIIVVTDPTTCTTAVVDGFPYNPAVPVEVDLCEEFDVNVCVEDVFAYDIDARNIFKNVTLFLWAKPARTCQ